MSRKTSSLESVIASLPPHIASVVKAARDYAQADMEHTVASHPFARRLDLVTNEQKHRLTVAWERKTKRTDALLEAARKMRYTR